MKIAHLVLTHKNPRQLERLLNSMDHPGFDFYLHIDGKADIRPFYYLADRPNVFFIKKRTPVYWAGFGTIQATLNGFAEIIPKNRYDYVNVISGQDFPLRSPEFIFNYIKERNGTEFITCQSIEAEWSIAADRVRKYHLINWRIPGKFRLEKLLNKILPRRRFPLDHKIVGRANWFTLTPGAIRYSLDFLEQHPELIRFYKYCWGADEFIFSTILYNSSFRSRIVDNLVYVDWTGQTEGHPRILLASDLPALKATDKLFARKFDMDADPQIFTLLEEWIASDRNIL
jgi:hypothetical protein